MNHLRETQRDGSILNVEYDVKFNPLLIAIDFLDTVEAVSCLPEYKLIIYFNVAVPIDDFPIGSVITGTFLNPQMMAILELRLHGTIGAVLRSLENRSSMHPYINYFLPQRRRNGHLIN